MSNPAGPLINCQNKDDYDLLRILLETTWIGDDGLLYSSLFVGGSGGATPESQQVDLVNGTNPFILLDSNGDPYIASIVQFYTKVGGTLHKFDIDYTLTGAIIIIENAGPDIANVVIKFI
jgi:hypothetical protein